MGSAVDQASTRPLAMAIRKRTTMALILVTKAPCLYCTDHHLVQRRVTAQPQAIMATGVFVYIDSG
ncbi:hypothetical protein FLM9_649 [Candidatus Synechococcus spongiarum]|uniref:Uncharacterized protein n=1 Tax=Candidatus Synechococcus spongiarum TaxID=431041 RepID=A0A165AFG5_9SYNE|nr:hypothetical protein FLM9_649 [Candidatus Synechococcus spongiarum]